MSDIDITLGAQAMLSDALEPVRVPAEFWQRAEVVATLDARDIGALFRLLRQRTGASQTRIGIAVGMPQSEISLIMSTGPRQRRVAALNVIVRIANGLNMPDAARKHLGLAPNSDFPAAKPVDGAHGRLVTTAGTNSGTEDPPPVGDQEITVDTVDVLSRIQRLNRSVDPEIIRNLHGSLWHNLAEYERLDHYRLGPAVLKQRAWTETLLDECNHPKQRQQLFEIAGAASGLLGYIAVGRGAFPLARAYCLEAFRLGDFAQDFRLQAWARGLQSFCEYYARQYDEALRLALDGLMYAQSGPQSVRLTINGAARAMGKLGNVEGVRRAVDDAYELMSRNDAPSGVPSSIALECYSPAQTAGNAATAYVSLGMPEEVQHYVELALPDMSRSASPWSHSLVMIDLAFSLIRAKETDLDRATELVFDAVNISVGRPIISVQQRASEFVHEAHRRWGDTRQVSTIREAVSTLEAR